MKNRSEKHQEILTELNNLNTTNAEVILLAQLAMLCYGSVHLCAIIQAPYISANIQAPYISASIQALVWRFIICNKIGYFVINFSIFFLLLFILSIYNKSYQRRTKSLSTNAHKEISTKQNVRPIGFRYFSYNR